MLIDSARRVLVRLVAMTAFVAALASPASAQAPAIEASGAYAYLADPSINMPAGWLADAAFRVSDTTSVVAEINHSRKAVKTLGVPFTLSVTTYQGGVRVTGRASRVAVFGQALGGFGRFGGRLSAGSIDLGLTLNAVTLQFGGGAIVPVGSRFGVRAGLDYRYAVMLSSDLPLEARQWRVTTGMVLAVGR